MRVLLLLPKPQCYNLKNLSTQRIYKDKFTKYIKLLLDSGCYIEVLLEDQLAFDMLGSMGVSPALVSTCISKGDLDWINKYPDIEEFSGRVFSEYGSANKVLYDSESKFLVPLSVMKEGHAVYYKERVMSYHKRYKYTIDRYITESPNVVQFRLNNSMDRGCSVSSTAKQGDGRLCVEVGVNAGFVSSYYGGVFVQEEHLPMILSL